MKKTIIYILLMVGIINLAMISALAVGTENDSLEISELGIKLIERYEGFSKCAYAYSTKYYIGYGTECEAGEYPNGISEEEAESLLLSELQGYEECIRKFLNDNGIIATQYQFDALVSFTYDLGVGWMNSTSRLYNYLIDGIGNYPHVEIVNSFGIWCHEGKKVSTRLVERRLAEAKLFLFGDDERSPHEYKYLICDAGDGKVEYDIVFYEYGYPYGNIAEAKLEGRAFMGWYTSSGVRIEIDKIALEDLSVCARWSDNGTFEENYSYSDVTADDWFYTYINDLSKKGVVGGYPDGTFQPNKMVSCGEALKLILLAAGYDPQDHAAGHWAGGYLDLAVSKELIDTQDITDLDHPISRQLVAQIAAKALGLTDTGIITPFADTSNPHVLSLYQHGIVEGSVDNGVMVFKPNDSICRSEISAVVWRINKMEADEGSNAGNITGNEQIQFGNHNVDILDSVPVNSYDSGSFYTVDGIMRYNSEEIKTCTGIDVSSFQGDIDWQKVKNAGIDYAIIRLGYRGYTTGSINLDTCFKSNIRGALNAGLKVGVYFFSQAITVEEAVEEAEFVLSYMKGYDISYPVVFDWENINEDSSRTNGLDTTTLSQCALAFCNRIENAGYKPMIYFNSYIGYLKYDLSKILEYDFWLAEYSDMPAFYYHFQMWQYTSSGEVAGISGAVDMNICFADY